jgi:hypothetical protein
VLEGDLSLPLELASHEIDRLGRIVSQLAAAEQARPLKAPERLAVSADEDTSLLALAKEMLRERQMRARHFPDAHFAEPVWMILLDLFIHAETGVDVSVSSACIGSGVPPTTALRHLSSMVSQGQVDRVPHPSDGRQIQVRLSPSARGAMRTYLSAVAARRRVFRAASAVQGPHVLPHHSA